MKRVLFIAKKGQSYSEYGYTHMSSGLRNSAKFIVDMLKKQHADVHFVQVIDNNDIDREVARFSPDVVFIEALWVVPEKFDVLRKLHPHVSWVIRIHSEIPFLAQEGIAVKWIRAYIRQDNVSVAFNSLRTFTDFKKLEPMHLDKMTYLPNFFPLDKKNKGHVSAMKHVIDVGCFGAIRPLKNQLIQAVAAIRYADSIGKRLRFHVNFTRVEGGANVLKNLRALFDRSPHHKLIEHTWLTHESFQRVLAGVDVAMCVSFTESFCIVAADAVSVNTPIVVSSEIRWASRAAFADPTNVDSIVATMDRVLKYKDIINHLNRYGLEKYDNQSRALWLNYIS